MLPISTMMNLVRKTITTTCKKPLHNQLLHIYLYHSSLKINFFVYIYISKGTKPTTQRKLKAYRTKKTSSWTTKLINASTKLTTIQLVTLLIKPKHPCAVCTENSQNLTKSITTSLKSLTVYRSISRHRKMSPIYGYQLYNFL